MDGLSMLTKNNEALRPNWYSNHKNFNGIIFRRLSYIARNIM